MGISSCIRRETGAIDFEERSERTKMILDYLSQQVSNQKEEIIHSELWISKDDSISSNSLSDETKREKTYAQEEKLYSQEDPISFESGGASHFLDLRNIKPTSILDIAEEPVIISHIVDADDPESLSPGTKKAFRRIKNSSVSSSFKIPQEPRVILPQTDPDALFNKAVKFKTFKFVRDFPEFYEIPPEIDIKAQRIQNLLEEIDDEVFSENDASLIGISQLEYFNKQPSSSALSSLLGKISKL